MARLTTPICEFGTKAEDFDLLDCDGQKRFKLAECVGQNGLLVMFICNHCPYVQAILPELVQTIHNLYHSFKINTVAIMSNNWEEYPDDSPANMLELKNQYNFKFPYLIDNTQEIARKYGAVCTPDFFGYNNKLELQYRGRFDARGRECNNQNNQSDLEQAMVLIANTGYGPKDQKSSIGCSIKWKE
ncbi:MAG: thioredoxin family protein [Gammaproteobacteria bacterium]|nr:thioredoxin family protein [Gammaproteobacteria bacterium]